MVAASCAHIGARCLGTACHIAHPRIITHVASASTDHQLARKNSGWQAIIALSVQRT
jgi:hypothetical protein